jgi:hypothetical protein
MPIVLYSGKTIKSLSIKKKKVRDVSSSSCHEHVQDQLVQGKKDYYLLTIPGNPSFTPLTISQIFSAFAITSSFVCNLGIGYWKTQTPTVSSELEI